MEDNWDLHAVVRGCATIASTTSSVSSSSVSSSVFSTTTCSYQQQHSASSSSSSPSSSSCGFFSMMILPSTTCEQKSNQVLSFSSNSNKPFEARNSIDEELHELCKPFFLKSQPNNTNFHHSFQTSSCCSSSSALSSSSFSYASSPNSVQAQQKQSSKHPHHAGSATTPRSKRRKNQLKKVCQVSAENLSSDIWAWRKYGQKPIKGSPYPRGYYRCSSSKGCLARKQVERNRTDPTMFIVTYTGEHNHPAPTHRNSLAGSTRQKPQTQQFSTNEDTENKTSSMMTKQQASPSTSCVEEEEEEEEELALAQKSESELEDNMEDFLMMNNDDNNDNDNDVFGSPDMEITDDFFEGLDELTVSSSSSSGECFSSVSAIPSLVAK